MPVKSIQTRRNFLKQTALSGFAGLAAGRYVFGAPDDPESQRKSRVKDQEQRRISENPPVKRPNVLLIFVDQLRACSLSVYGDKQIATPNIDRLAKSGVVLDNMISTCPVCTPYRSMLMTGRHPQTTGHLYNFIRTRHDEIGWGDIFSHAGYRTGWIGKWHLHVGDHLQREDTNYYVPGGRDRLGFEYWRGYNFHMTYFDGPVNMDNGRSEPWRGYETDALNRFAFEFLDKKDKRPFCLLIAPHQPHFTPGEFVPKRYYDRLPRVITLPANVPAADMKKHLKEYRHYLAMTLAVDDMLGELLDYLDKTGKARDTLVIFTSDHGTMGGAHNIDVWAKKLPYEESIRVPFIMRLPGSLEGGLRRDTLTAPVDILPSICTLCGVPVPRTVEGLDLSGSWKGTPGAREQEAVLTMNFSRTYNELIDGKDWRGVRTRDYSYTRWIDGKRELYDLRRDPLEMENMAAKPEGEKIVADMERILQQLLAKRGDKLVNCTTFENWYDKDRNVIRNAYGPLGDPMAPPDWSLLLR